MRVLVTGRNGQLAEALRLRAARYPAFDLNFAGRPEFDLERPSSLREFIVRDRPSVIINAAAYTQVDRAEDEPERAFLINGESAGVIAEAASVVGSTLIQISTDYVFDGAAAVPYAESAPTNPQNVYGRSKLLGEELVRQKASRHIILRTAWVYSPFGHNFLKTMVGLRDRDEVSVVADQFGSPTAATDLAEGIFQILETWTRRPELGLGGTYHLAGSGAASWHDFARTIFDQCTALTGAAPAARAIASSEWPTKAVRPAFSVLSSSRFFKTFGFQMPAWDHSVRDTVTALFSSQLRSP